MFTRKLVNLAALLTVLPSISIAQLSSLPTGRLDRSYGENGYAFAQAHVTFMGNTKMLPDQKIVWVGSSYPSIHVTRTLPTGDVDPSFGVNGHYYGAFGTEAVAWDIAAQSDGKLIVVGSKSDVGAFREHDFVVLRLTPNGTLDKGFGNNGVVIKDFAVPNSQELSNDYGASVLAKPDGAILVLGTSRRATTPNARATTYLTMMQLDPDGNVDSSFGSNGTAQHQIGNDWYGGGTLRQIYSSLQADGKILVGATADRPDKSSPNGYGQRGVLLRLLPSGELDSSFADKGQFVLHPQGWSAFGAPEQLPDGRIIAPATWAIAVLNPKGSLDASFGQSGVYYTYGKPMVAQVVHTDDGKFIFAGAETVPLVPTGATQIGKLQRIHSNGLPDLRFGQMGTTRAAFGETMIGFARVHPLNAKQAIVTGVYDLQHLNRLFTARYTISK